MRVADGAEYMCDVHQMTATAVDTGLTGVLRRDLVVAKGDEISGLIEDESPVDALAWEFRVPEAPFWPSDEPQLLRVKCAGLATAGPAPSPASQHIDLNPCLGSTLLDFRYSGSGSAASIERARVAATAAAFGPKECWTAPELLNVVIGDPFLADGALRQLPAHARAGETALLLKRGLVPFVEKARRAAAIGAGAVLIVNTEQQHFRIEGHTYNDSSHAGRQTDNGEGMESLPVVCLPLEEGTALEARLRAGEKVQLENLRYTADPEERVVLVPPGCRPSQKLRFHHPIWWPETQPGGEQEGDGG